MILWDCYLLTHCNSLLMCNSFMRREELHRTTNTTITLADKPDDLPEFLYSLARFFTSFRFHTLFRGQRNVNWWPFTDSKLGTELEKWQGEKGKILQSPKQTNIKEILYIIFTTFKTETVLITKTPNLGWQMTIKKKIKLKGKVHFKNTWAKPNQQTSNTVLQTKHMALP